MGKTKQKQLEQLQNFFLSKKNLSFQEIDWKYIFSWSNNLNLNAELSVLAKTYEFEAITIFSLSGEIIVSQGQEHKWDDFKTFFNTFGNTWTKSQDQSKLISGFKINNIRNQTFYISILYKKENFKVENIKRIRSILILLSLSTKLVEVEDDKLLHIEKSAHHFPVIEPHKIHVIRTGDVNKHGGNIKEIVTQLGFEPHILLAGDIKFIEESNHLHIVHNIQSWGHLQEEFLDTYKELEDKGKAPAILFCFDIDPFHLYRKGKLTEKLYQLISSVECREYSLEPIIESCLDENKINEILETVWDIQEKQSA